ncbi:MAG TPA: ribonuclease P protein component [Lentisphaeria bacterium]|nr:ribonuclease P protein component [Lentisphaerota bacterium]OQC16979.1 MAG: ribonuclease P [Lentisphaerae bacterium ADurb.Bin082]HQC53873.1 ribonuclease P protein component [Lentisphaeria bacterium]HQL86961.1 ribonuclease P protein component [Lentisphaeria bacterium]
MSTQSHGSPSRRHPAFGRDARLRAKWQFDAMRASADKQVGKFCVLIALKTPPDSQRRAAFSISRRYSPLAVTRNRARRLFRETYRQLYPALPPVWLLFIPRHTLKKAKLADVVGDVLGLVERLGLGRLALPQEASGEKGHDHVPPPASP